MFWVMAVLTAVCPPLRITFQARAPCSSLVAQEGLGLRLLRSKIFSGGPVEVLIVEELLGRVFPPSNSSVISLWCPQKDVCILSAWLGLEIPMTEGPELLGVVGHYL